MTSTLKIFDHSTLTRIRSKVLEDGFEEYLIGGPEEIAERVGGRMIDSGIDFDADASMELPAIGEHSTFDEVDIINTEVIHDALPRLTAFEACRDELWATLSLGNYAQYVRRRWRASSQQDFDLRRNYRLHYLASGARSRWRDNAIGRLWWLRHYSETMLPNDPMRALRVFFFRDKNLGEAFLTKPSIATVPAVARSVLNLAYERFIDPGHSEFNRDAFRRLIQGIDINTGRSLLPLMPEERVRELVTSQFDQLFAIRETGR
jgi:hypothetical protein